MAAASQISTPEPVSTERALCYAVYTRSRHEKVVDQSLNESGIETFLPLLKTLSNWKDRRKWVEKPLFPGYLFAKLPPEQLYQVQTTRGVAYVLGNGSIPVPVPDEQVEAVRCMVEGPYQAAAWPLLTKGQRVRVIAGALTGVEAFIVDKRGGKTCNLVVTVDLLGRSVAVEIDADCVEPIS